MCASLPEKDVADEGADHLVDAPEVRADDEHRDDHDDRPLDGLGAVRPVDLAKLGDRLGDEATPAARRVLDGRDRRSTGPSRLRDAAARLVRALVAGGPAGVAALPARL